MTIAREVAGFMQLDLVWELATVTVSVLAFIVLPTLVLPPLLSPLPPLHGLQDTAAFKSFIAEH